MASLRDAVKTLLSGDGTLSTLLPGGVFHTEDFSFDEGGSDEAPRQANGVSVDPFAYIRLKDTNRFGPFRVGGEMGTMEVYAYDNVGYATLDTAISRIKALLHEVRVTADDRQLAYFEYVHISGELPAPELGYATSMFIRFSITQVR